LINSHGDQTEAHVAPDGAGGVFVVWTDPRAYARSTDIYVVRIDADGQRGFGWQYYGQAVCDAAGAQSQPRVTVDGTGGLWAVWLDLRASSDGDLRYSHVLGDGSFAPGFTSDGAPLCSAAGAQGEAVLAGDGAGGFFAAWRDDRSGAGDIYLQHVRADGTIG